MFSDPDDGENAAVINTISDLLKPLVFLFCALFSALLLRNFPFGCSPHFISGISLSFMAVICSLEVNNSTSFT